LTEHEATTANKKLRVLIDLSFAAFGYCGIAQDVRLLYKALASSPELDVTGLVCLPHRLRPLHKFLSTSAHRGDRLSNQACFLWQLDQESANWPPLKSVQRLKHLRQLASTLLRSRIQTDLLEIDSFWDVVWRLLFSQTLAADDLPLVRGGKFLLCDMTRGMIQSRVLLHRRPLKLDTSGYDFMIVNGSRPLRLSPGTRQIVRHHDLIPLLRPDAMRNPWYIRWYHQAIRQADHGAYFVCDSDPSRQDLAAAYPELSDKSETIPCILTDIYRPDPQLNQIRSIIEMRRSSAAGVQPAKRPEQTPRYIMCVSTLEPRKNFIGLIQAFNMLRGRAIAGSGLDDLKLLIVGSPGWKFEPILAAMRPLVEQGDLLHLERVPAEELRVLYTHAAAFVFPSNYEGFGLPPLEAMQCGAPVIASDIDTHRWVLGDAALYCNPYDMTSLAATIERLVASRESIGLREKLIARGRERVKLYHPDRCSGDWLALLHRLQAGGTSSTANEPSRLAGPRLMEKVA
jgi:glycosyltransferase involved in cell wall biosynthesis